MQASRSLLLFVAFSITVSLVAGSVQAASSASATDRINLSNSPGQKSGKDVVAARNSAYVAWFDRSTSEIIFKKITHGKVDVTMILESGISPQIAVEGKKVYLFYDDSSDGKVHVKKSGNSGKSFDDGMVLGVPAGAAIAVQRGNMYAAYSIGEGRMQIAKSSDGGITFLSMAIIEGSNIEVHYPEVKYSTSQRLFVDGNNVYLAWAEGAYPPSVCDCPYLYRYQDVFFSRSTDGGSTFGPTVNLSGDLTGYFGDPQISAYKNHVYVAWHVERGLPYFTLNTYIAVSDDWADSFTVIGEAGGSQSFDSDISASKSGAYMVLANYTSGSTEILVRSGDQFERAAAAGAANWSNDPHIAADGRYVYIVWEEGDDGAGYENDVFFRAYKLKDFDDL